MTLSPRANVLQQALDLTMGARNATYGDPTDNHNNIARLWRAYVQTRGIALREIDAEDVMIMMALLKIARIGQRLDRANADSYIDACAYIAMAVEPYLREPALHGEG